MRAAAVLAGLCAAAACSSSPSAPPAAVPVRADPAATARLLLCGSLAGGLWLAFATYHLSAMWGGAGSIIP